MAAVSAMQLLSSVAVGGLTEEGGREGGREEEGREGGREGGCTYNSKSHMCMNTSSKMKPKTRFSTNSFSCTYHIAHYIQRRRKEKKEEHHQQLTTASKAYMYSTCMQCIHVHVHVHAHRQKQRQCIILAVPPALA